ncbi:MAG: hypothetical protein [Circular genetic element sp.]|nr:MAG: hypothetical protein [Circular genetic element sp.]
MSILTKHTIFRQLTEVRQNIRTLALFTEGCKPTVTNSLLQVTSFKVDESTIYCISNHGRVFSAAKIINDDNPYQLFATMSQPNLTNQPASLKDVVTHCQCLLTERHALNKRLRQNRLRQRYSPNIARSYTYNDESGYFIIDDNGTIKRCNAAGKDVPGNLPVSLLTKLSAILNK